MSLIDNTVIAPPLRGEWRNKKAGKQLVCFTDLKYDTITPTDVDLFFERHDTHFVFAETKKEGTPPQGGQELALKRLCDAVTTPMRAAVFFETTHNTPFDEDLFIAETKITRYRYKGQWHTPKDYITLKNGIDIFLSS